MFVSIDALRPTSICTGFAIALPGGCESMSAFVFAGCTQFRTEHPAGLKQNEQPHDGNNDEGAQQAQAVHLLGRLLFALLCIDRARPRCL